MRTSANMVICRAFRLAVLLSHLWFCQTQPHCVKDSCGNFSNISYPFGLADSHVQGHPNRHCGHPDFQVLCNSGTPHLAINGVNYTIVGRPSYNPNKITLVNDAVLTNSVCGVPDASVNLTHSPFSLPSSFTFQILHIGCSQADIWPVSLCNNSIVNEVNPVNNFLNCKSFIMVPIPIGLTILPEEIEKDLRKGFDVLWNEMDEAFESCRKCREQSGFCGFNESNLFVCYYPHEVISSANESSPVPSESNTPHTERTDNSTETPHNSPKTPHKYFKGFLIGVCVGSALLISFAVILALRRRTKDFKSQSLIKSGKDKDMELGPQLLCKRGSVQVFTYHELEQATDSFDMKRELGDGGFASVYLGKLCDGRSVAVKKLFHDNCKRVEQFHNEVRILSQLNHPNLVLLIGYCHYRSELLLVYEYASNGTLAHHLHGQSMGKDLTWQTRLNIALETAQALSYLHFCVKPPIFHRDVKSSNILLDQNFSAKVADFGLCRLVPPEATHVSTGPQGTPGYLDPDYHQYFRLTDKSDVYSFGVVLAEVISAKKAVDITRENKEVGLANLAVSKIQCGALHELVDPNLEVEKNPQVKEMVSRVSELAFRCLASDKDDRPNMMEVAAQLHQIKEFGYGRNSKKQFSSTNLCDSDLESKKLLNHVFFGSPTSVQQSWKSTSTTPDSGASS